MFSTLSKRFGVPGVIAVAALVFAMIGGAYAANGSGGGKAVTSKARRGPRGPRGPQGPVGPQGPAGPAGSQGVAGSPWTAGGTLPKGATETGAWAVQANSGGGAIATLTFGIPLTSALSEANIKLVQAGQTGGSGCTGGTAANPKADSGFLCVYIGNLQDATLQIAEIFNPTVGPLFGAGPESAAKSGAGLFLGLENGSGALVSGTYAVTG